MNEQEIQKEVSDVELLWHRFLAEQANGPNADWHPPIAMQAIAQGIAQEYMKAQEYTAFPEDQDEWEDNWQAILRFGDVMFHMGQYAYANGVLRANMTPCQCTQLSDDQIKSFFDGVEFGKGE